ncbi:L-lactate dehydrogenase complex protein LldF [Chitinophaga jiangningensis]|uniref:L-lactate dehydrogenase complex protein LldF n=1 Tax=Chitinophaga jiangningensis TaxID=1419482 RepID=A0A1M7FAV2_9BACT|nr:lactate utilization protein B [Chitinophaga jiangningensis]SHM00898.1 L-lactate dehydrogenase complex protein LldF [Chitinophaga jiangningensis]
MAKQRVDVAGNAASFIDQDDIHEPVHDKNLWAARMKRDAAARAVPEWEDLRTIASLIKEHTLTHLDHYLEMFEANAIKRGAKVYWARDAAEHNQHVWEILSARNIDAIIKSKSMLQEECGMTAFLENRGISVTESDLGERIQQLDNQPPSHIVMPAIHKTPADIAGIFAKAIGTDPNNTDPHYLNEAMRADARKRFLKAGAGMTGANFAIAETGTFVVCTNEGNADIGASVPPVHIASIGIEKLLPKVSDLGVFIRLLSRSALGTLATQYTSHFSGPRKGGELHIIITDNGRSKRLGLDDFWHSLKCIRCGACMNTCPVYRRSGGLAYGATYSGPIGIILDPTFDESKYSELPYHSTLCGSCSEVCPVKIDISDQILKWRKVMAAKKYLPISRRLAFGAAGKVFEHPTLFHGAETAASAAMKVTPHFLLYNRGLNPWGRHRELPHFAKQTFREWYLQYKQTDKDQEPQQ